MRKLLMTAFSLAAVCAPSLAGQTVIRAGAFPEPATWSLRSARPILQIGQLEGDDPYLFGSVWDATRFADGTVAITDGQTFEIRLFDSSGRHIRSFGGRGEGPAEYSGPPWLRSAGAELWAWDAGALRLTKLDRAGRVVSQVTPRDEMFELGVSRFPNGPVWALNENGALLWSGPDHNQGRPTEGIQEQLIALISMDAGGVLHRHGSYPDSRVIFKNSEGVGVRGMGDMFSPRTRAALAPDGTIVVADASSWELRSFTPDGESTGVLRGDPPRLRLSRSVIAAERAGLDDMAYRLGIPLRDVEEMFDQLDAPDLLPPIGDLFVDRIGRRWVGRRTTTYRISVYDVLDDDGEYLGSVDVGPITKILEVGRDYILVSESDEFEVNYVRMYPLPEMGG